MIHRSKLGAFALLAVLAIALGGSGCGGDGGGTPACTAAPLPAAWFAGPMTGPEEADARMVFSLVNAHRAGLALPALTWHTGAVGTMGAAQCAYNHSTDMMARGFFSHTSPGCQDPGDRLTALGIGWSAWAENIAQGQATPAAVMTSWLNSPPHRANIESLAVTHLGVGVRFGPGGPWWTQVFLTP